MPLPVVAVAVQVANTRTGRRIIVAVVAFALGLGGLLGLMGAAALADENDDTNTAANGCAGVSAPVAAGADASPAALSVDALSTDQVAAYAAGVGFRDNDLVLAVAVARAESGNRPTASHVNSNGSTDYGLWQINSVHAALLAGHDWRDPAQNAAMAYEVWRGAGGSWKPWTTFTGGKYTPYLAEAQLAVRTLGTLPDAAPANSGTTTNGAGIAAPACAQEDGTLTDPGPGAQNSTDHLTPRAENVKSLTQKTWGCDVIAKPVCISSIGGYAKRNIAGTGVLSDHATGNAVDIMIPDYKSAPSRTLGKQIADYFVANADRLGVKYVIYYDQIWTRDKAAQGWRPYRHPSGDTSDDNLQHRTHVHVSVKQTPKASTDPADIAAATP